VSGFSRSKVQKQTRLQRYNTLTVPTLLYGSTSWTLKDQQKSKITAEEMEFLRKTIKTYYLTSKDITIFLKDLKYNQF
jgi:hypothetical protein